MRYPLPKESLRGAILRWEVFRDKQGRLVTYQDVPADAGNWVRLPDGSRRNVGTNWGIIPNTYATYLGVEPWTVTRSMMKGITLDIACDVGVELFYKRPGFVKLPWCPLIEAAFDTGWGSGPPRAIRFLQEMVGAQADGVIGPQTVRLVWEYMGRTQMSVALAQFRELRRSYYLAISDPDSTNRQHRANHRFRDLWLGRADYFRVENPDFMRTWSNPNKLIDAMADPDMGDFSAPATPSVEPPAPPRKPVEREDGPGLLAIVLSWIARLFR